MSAARITAFVALALLAVALVSASSSRDDEPAVPGAEKDVRAPGAPVVEAELPADRPVRAGVGDVVRLRVRARRGDEARLARLALAWPVGPGLRGDVEFVAARAGRFAVTLRSGARVGTLVVEG